MEYSNFDVGSLSDVSEDSNLSYGSFFDKLFEDNVFEEVDEDFDINSAPIVTPNAPADPPETEENADMQVDCPTPEQSTEKQVQIHPPETEENADMLVDCQTPEQSNDSAEKQVQIPDPKAQFKEISNQEVLKFIEDMENPNTKNKTLRDTKLFQSFLTMKGEERKMECIPPIELDPLLANFVCSVRKRNGEEYEPSTIRQFISSIDRKLKRHKYGASIMNSNTDSFILTQDALKSKQKNLKSMGKGNKPHKSSCLTDADIDILYQKDLLGRDTAESLLNTLWLNNTVLFGLRGSDEHYKLKWGDLTMKETPQGITFIEFNERISKTRNGENGEIRSTIPKMFETPLNPARCPVQAYQKYASLRPSGYSSPDDHFYLAPRTVPHTEDKENDIWFKKQKVGDKKLSSLMKVMANKANLNKDKKLTNHSGRKRLVQKLRDNNVSTVDIMQITGHKSERSINNYSELSTKRHEELSNILQTNSIENSSAASISNLTTATSHIEIMENSPHTEKNFQNPMILSSSTNQYNSLFSGAVLNIQNMNVYLQSPTNDKE